jgi:hypothetical protein
MDTLYKGMNHVLVELGRGSIILDYTTQNTMQFKTSEDFWNLPCNIFRP